MKETKVKLKNYLTRQKLRPKEVKKKDSIKKIKKIFAKKECLRSPEDVKFLETFEDIKLLETIKKQTEKRKDYQIQLKTRIVETEDSADIIETKVKKLAQIILKANHLVCYTGAGISTSAKIPDYRGSQGIWTLLKEGKEFGKHDISKATPTFTHMALFELHRRKILRHIISQNCDGLHLRSGIPRKSLSELHGNMYIEVCKICKPNLEYLRLFDTTEDTARFNHSTKRFCHICKKSLSDTIVHFGERGSLKWPLNWAGACNNSEKADVILCLGSSLKVLKKYTWLWQNDLPKKQRAKLLIVNLQWTPKDKQALVKVNGKCDDVMLLLMKQLNMSVPTYNRSIDPIFHHFTPLLKNELDSVTQPILKIEENNKKLALPLKELKSSPPTKIKTNLNCNPLEMEEQNKFFRYSKTKLENNFTKKGLELENIHPSTEIFRKAEISTTNNLYSKEEFCAAYLNSNIQFDLEKSIPAAIIPAQSNVQDQPVSFDNVIVEGCTENYQQPILSYTASNYLITTEQSRQFKTNMISKSLDITLYLPNWYEPSWCYPGLHQIIKPPPKEINFWSSTIVPILANNKKQASCTFCFENYDEFSCQFYRNILNMKSNKKRKICNDIQDNANENMNNSTKEAPNAGWFGKGYRKIIKKRKK